MFTILISTLVSILVYHDSRYDLSYDSCITNLITIPLTTPLRYFSVLFCPRCLAHGGLLALLSAHARTMPQSIRVRLSSSLIRSCTVRVCNETSSFSPLVAVLWSQDKRDPVYPTPSSSLGFHNRPLGEARARPMGRGGVLCGCRVAVGTCLARFLLLAHATT